MLRSSPDSIRLLYRNSMRAVAASIALAMVVVFALWDQVPHRLLLGWLALLMLVNGIRLLHFRAYFTSDGSVPVIDRESRRFRMLACAAGIVWGAAIVLFDPRLEPIHQMFLVVVLGGNAAGASVTLSGVRGAYTAFVVPMLLPLIFIFLTHGDVIHLSLAVATALFMVVMLGVSWRINDYISNYTRLLREERSQRRVMELLAGATPLPEILAAIVLEFELHNPGSACSILLLDATGKHLNTAAAPSLPGEYNDAINGLMIGPHVGCCGTAAYTGERSVVEDIQSHPDWAGLAGLATSAGLKACWSEPIFGSSGKVLGTFAIYHRFSCVPNDEEIRQIESAGRLAGVAIERGRLQDELLLASMVYQNSAEAMVVTDDADRVVAINPAFTQITGYSAEEIVGRDIGVYRAGSAGDSAYHAMTESIRDTGRWQGEIWNSRKDGERFAEWITVSTIFKPDGGVHRRVALISDITEQKRSDELIWKQANYDALTGLPNRRLFRDRLELEVRKSHRAEGRMALLFLDLDRFKEVNDTLGHDAGDLLLVEAARRISGSVRESDTVARLGGDEFTIILSELDDVISVERVAQSIVQRMAEPFHLDDERVYVSASIGITIYPDDSAEVDGLLRNADQAMYEAKRAGRNRFSYFTGAMQQVAHKRLRMISDLRSALSAGQLLLEYQPIVELASRRVVKAEALVRWQHPRMGLIGPGEFIPIAEEIGLINEIGDWVFDEAARQATRWRDVSAPDFRLSINMSPLQFQSATRAAGMIARLPTLGSSAQNLMVEITEGMLLHGNPAIADQLALLQHTGMKIAIDDFGTGYSSLSYLKKFRIDVLKIDRSFVRDLASDPNDRALAESIIAMAHKLGLVVVAEGVETEEQHRILLAAGCDFGQGYLYAKPLAAKYFGDLLAPTGVSS